MTQRIFLLEGNKIAATLGFSIDNAIEEYTCDASEEDFKAFVDDMSLFDVVLGDDGRATITRKTGVDHE